MLRQVLGDRLKHCPTFPEMFAADGVMELPFAPPGFNTPLEGRDAIAAHFRVAMKLVKLNTVSHVITHETSDPEVAILEFAASGVGLTTGEPYDQHYISVIRTRDGKIIQYKDYWNPLAILRTIKCEEIVQAFDVE